MRISQNKKGYSKDQMKIWKAEIFWKKMNQDQKYKKVWPESHQKEFFVKIQNRTIKKYSHKSQS